MISVNKNVGRGLPSWNVEKPIRRLNSNLGKKGSVRPVSGTHTAHSLLVVSWQGNLCVFSTQ